MTNTNITNFRKNLFDYMNQAINFGEVINVSSKSGNAVVMSEEDYKSLMATVELLSIPGMKEKLLEGKNTPISECVPEDEVKW